MSAPELGETVTTRLAWMAFAGARHRDAAGVPRVPAEYVAEQGQHVRIIDVRRPEELSGILGHIPAVTHVPLAEVGTVAQRLAPGTPLVVVSNTGSRASVAALYLESLGMTHVAAMTGGMAEWKKLGFSSPREPETVRWELKVLPPGVGRNGRPLQAVTKGSRLDEQQIVDHLGDPGAVRWVKLAAFLLHGKRSCVDGRDDHGVIGTPGGDAGEFLLAMSVAEDVRGAPFSDEDVARALMSHVDTFGRFYMHSDVHAMNHLIVEGFRKDERLTPHIAKVFQATEWRDFLRSPPLPLRDVLLEHLVEPQNLGCGHLKFSLTRDAYHLRPDLGRAFLRAFHHLRWSGAPELEFVILGGDHVEGAVVEVVLEGELQSYTRIPLVAPQVDGLQMFVAHPQVTRHLRRETAMFLCQTGLVPMEKFAALDAGISARGDEQLGATLGALAKGLPIYRVTYGGTGAATVELRGAV